MTASTAISSATSRCQADRRGMPRAPRRAMGRHRRAADAGGVRRGAGRHARRSPACRCTRLWTMLHVPQISLPVFKGPAGMPIGAQLIARRHDDRKLFACAQWAYREADLEDHMVADTDRTAPGPSRSPATCAGATPRRSSKAWCRMAPPPWREIDNIAPAAQGARGRGRSRRRVEGGMGARGRPRRRVRRQGRRRGPHHHRRQPVHARRQLLLQRRALHPAGRREARDVSQGAALLPGRDAAAASRHRAGRGARTSAD